MGIEPTWPVWKTGTLPLSYARLNATQCSREVFLVNERTHERQKAFGDCSALLAVVRTRLIISPR